MADVIPTTPTDAVEEDPLLLYSPVARQINGKKIPWTIDYPKVSPRQAQTWLREADEYDKFHQRKRTKARKDRWLTLMQSNRFVEYLPLGALCFNEDGIIMNGGNRLAALAEFDRPLGFTVVNNCPSWLMNYFDNGNNRTQRESAMINKRPTDADFTATTRLGMRYEEFLFGKRRETGWTEWGRHKDEFVDIDNFMDRREYLLDFIPRGKLLKKKINMQASSVACFIAYQQLAWPDGTEKIEEFLDALQLGTMLDKGNPALTLREWTRNDGYIGGYTHGRREGQLLLLFKFFTLFAEGHKIHEVRVAKGLPMSMPYHPDGWDMACKNTREALLHLEN